MSAEPEPAELQPDEPHAPQGDEPPNEPEPEPQGDEPDWKAEARKWEKRAKSNADAAERLKQLEDEQKTEQQRLQERVEQLEPSEQEAARLRVALRKGLTETQAKRLVGDSEDDLEADADDLLASFQSSEPDDTTRRPRERLKPGATGDSEPEADPKQVADSVWNTGGL